MENLASKIEAILFFKGEPVALNKLGAILKVSTEEIQNALSILEERLKERGIVLIRKEEEVALGTAPEFALLIEDLQKEELNKELSKASLETLSIILYKNGASRAEIDFIRGVNSSFTLRALCVRGLVEKLPHESDSRRYVYKPALEMLSFLGLKNIEELPEYSGVSKDLAQAQKSLDESLANS